MDSRSPEAERAGPAPDPPAGAGPQPAGADEGSSVRRTLVRVIVAQAVALGLLWLLQAVCHV